MRGIDTLLNFASNFNHFTGLNLPFQQQLPNHESYSALRLTHVVQGVHRAFHINGDVDAANLIQNSEPLKYKTQTTPKFNHHTDAESVLQSWKASLELRSGFASPFAESLNVNRKDASQWHVERTVVPDVTDKSTVLTLAKLAANAYVPIPFEGDWSDVNGTDSGGWDYEGDGYGWDDDSIRGYIFTSEDRSLMVISIKGTSTSVLDSGGPTAPNDKENDNLFFSCCCARINRMWSTVCDCYMGDGQCDEQCLEAELWQEDRYYRRALNVYEDARKLVPEATTVWITGHSLGGGLSSMLGRTFGIPVVTFEAPGEDLPVRRLHLPVPPGLPPWEDYVWHFGHNADPIFMGTCSGSGSTCSLKGFAMETKCHSGQICVYDVKTDLGWRESIVNHRIHVVIDNVLEVYDEPATCITPEYCEDCYNWDFVDTYNTPEPSKTSKKTTSKTETRTSTANPTSTQTLTSSCISRAWYGKCDEWTTYPVTATSVYSSESCLSYDWLGQCQKCTTAKSTAAPTATSCVSYDWLGQCQTR